ncbi:MAG: SMC-Scp complex subunit ScpB [Candidatus Adlerbacteria bacterium]|nr:SMC-Scp complex subunit ScpB [Candidatus Adlerbacteria bacterium]
MNENALAIQIEGLLFSLGRPLTRAELCKATGAELDMVEVALATLRARTGGGIVLVDDGKVVELRTAPAAAELVEKIRKEEYSRDIGKAGLEALAAVIYRGPLSRSEIDFIRGVNSSQTLRTLLMRGLVRKISNPKDERSFLYEPTTELLAELGVTHKDELPDYVGVQEKLRTLETAYRAQEVTVPTEDPL